MEKINYSKKLYSLGGIYSIKNLFNNKRYIGYTILFEKRFKQHFKSLKGNYHINSHLQNAYNKYGSNNFIFEILEVIENIDSIEILKNKEIKLIKQYDSYNNGYNLTKGGNGSSTFVLIYQFEIINKNNQIRFKFDRTYDGKESLKRHLNYNHPKQLVEGTTKSKEYSDKYIFLDEIERSKLNTNEEINKYLLKKYKKIQSRLSSSYNLKNYKPSKEKYKEMAKNREKKVYQFDLEGNILNIWDSLKEVSSFYNVCTIAGVVNGRKKSSVGCIFKYEKDIDKNLISFYEKESSKINLEDLKKYKKKEQFEKAISMLSIDNTFIKNFKSISEAARELNVTPQCISRNLRGETQRVKKVFKFIYD
jgi:group I intron endonuclease